MSTSGGLGGGRSVPFDNIGFLQSQVTWAEKDLEKARKALFEAEQCEKKRQEEDGRRLLENSAVDSGNQGEPSGESEPLDPS